MNIGRMTDGIGGGSSRRALILIPVVTMLILAILWITTLVRLHVEKAGVLRDTRVAALTLADALDTHTLKTIHDVDEIALLVKFGLERSPRTFNLDTYRAYGLITADTALQVTVAGPDGHVVASTLPYTGVIDLSDRAHFRVHRGRIDNGLFISQPVLGRISKQWAVQGTRRINRPDRSFGGVVIVSENPAYLTDGFYNNAALKRNGMIAVPSGRGFMLSRRAGDSPSRAGEAMPSGYMAPGDGGVAELTDPLDHVQRIVAARRLERYGLTVIAGLSVDEALADYYRMRRVYVTMATAISLVLIGLSAWIVALVRKLINGKEALQRISQTDRLTGLPNRGRIVDLLDEAIAAPHAAGNVAAIFVDLNNFKDYNDTYGHQCGDDILAAVATRLRTTVGMRGVVGRLGGDEFLIVVKARAAAYQAARVMDELTLAFEAPLASQWGTRTVGVSVGVAVLQAGEHSGDMIRRADSAMYADKNRACAQRATVLAYRAAPRDVDTNGVVAPEQPALIEKAAAA